MSAEDLIKQFDEFGITDYIIREVGHIFDFYNREEFAFWLTLVPQKDILNRLLGRDDKISLEYNEKINRFIEEENIC